MLSDDGPAMLHAAALALLHGLEGSPHPKTPFLRGVLIVERLKTADFERAMKLVTSRIDVQDDDKLMQMVYKEAVGNGGLKLEG